MKIEQTNEVARLREQLTRVIQIAEKFRWYTRTYEWLSMKDDLDKIKAEHEARFAPSPEEPKTSAHPDKCIGNVKSANPTCDNTTHKFSHCDCEEPVSNGTRIAAETRSACNDMTEDERTKYAQLAEDVLKLHKPDDEIKAVVQDEEAPDHLHSWMRLQEEINKEVAGELQNLRDEIQKLKQK